MTQYTIKIQAMQWNKTCELPRCVSILLKASTII